MDRLRKSGNAEWWSLTRELGGEATAPLNSAKVDGSASTNGPSPRSSDGALVRCLSTPAERFLGTFPLDHFQVTTPLDRSPIREWWWVGGCCCFTLILAKRVHDDIRTPPSQEAIWCGSGGGVVPWFVTHSQRMPLPEPSPRKWTRWLRWPRLRRMIVSWRRWRGSTPAVPGSGSSIWTGHPSSSKAARTSSWFGAGRRNSLTS